MPNIKVLIVEDQHIVAEGLRYVLEKCEEIEIIGHAYNGLQAIQKLEDEEVNVVLLDIHMPVMNGLDTCKKISASFPEIKVIALTMSDRGSMVQQMLKNGASGYLLKNCTRSELEEAIKTVYNGDNFISNKANQALIQRLSGAPKKSQYIELTPRESEVLQLIGEELTTAEIAKKLFLSSNTIETHRRNLLEKFQVKNSIGLIKKAISLGMIE